MEKEVKRLQLFLQSYLDAEHGNQANYVPTFYKSKMQKIANNRQYYFSIEYINELGDGEEFHIDADIYGYLCFIIALLEDLERREKLALGVIANDYNYTQIEPDENSTWPSKKSGAIIITNETEYFPHFSHQFEFGTLKEEIDNFFEYANTEEIKKNADFKLQAIRGSATQIMGNTEGIVLFVAKLLEIVFEWSEQLKTNSEIPSFTIYLIDFSKNKWANLGYSPRLPVSPLNYKKPVIEKEEKRIKPAKIIVTAIMEKLAIRALIIGVIGGLIAFVKEIISLFY